MTDDDLCRMSNLPPDQCALPCHRNEWLPAGVAAEVMRGVEPTGVGHMLTEPASEQHEPRDTRSRPRRPTPLKTACRYVDDEWVTREHLRDCASNTCEGCKPCGKDHCALFGSCPNHVGSGVATCPSCIGEFRANVGEIETLTALVHAELEHASIDSEVTNLAGPFADPDQLDARREFITRLYDARGWSDWPRLSLFDVDEQHHPVEVLARWERDLRREYEQPDADEPPAMWPLPHHVQRDVLSRSAGYLRGMLDGRFPHDEPFEACARDIRRLRTNLEGVLSDSRAPETGAPCPTCAAELAYTDRKPSRLVKRHGHWCDDPKCEREHVSTVVDKDGVVWPDLSKDRWVCPDNPNHEWSDKDYLLWVESAYLAHADRLTTADIKQQYGIPTGTIRRWASTTRKRVDGETVDVPPKLRSVGKTRAGVLLYRVSDVLALRAREGGRTKEAADA